MQDSLSDGERVDAAQQSHRARRAARRPTTETIAWVEGYDLLQERHGLGAGRRGLARSRRRERPAKPLLAIERRARLRQHPARGGGARALRAGRARRRRALAVPLRQGGLRLLRRSGVAATTRPSTGWRSRSTAAASSSGSSTSPATSACRSCSPIIAPKLDGYEQHWKHFDLSSGVGLPPSPARAAIRAITEAAQSRVTSITGARDDFDPEPLRHAAQGRPDRLSARPIRCADAARRRRRRAIRRTTCISSSTRLRAHRRQLGDRRSARGRRCPALPSPRCSCPSSSTRPATGGSASDAARSS